MPEKVPLSIHLKRFNSIAWFPTDSFDGRGLILSMIASLTKGDVRPPDCFLYTGTSGADDLYFGEILRAAPLSSLIIHGYDEWKVEAFNIHELIPLVRYFVPTPHKNPRDEYLGRVFAMDVLVEHPVHGRAITHLVYAFVCSARFAFEWLLPKCRLQSLRINFVIRSDYKNVFGGDGSTGSYINHIMKDLETSYFVSDNTKDIPDDAMALLSPEQKRTFPVLKPILNLGNCCNWRNEDDVVLYRVVDFEERRQNE